MKKAASSRESQYMQRIIGARILHASFIWRKWQHRQLRLEKWCCHGPGSPYGNSKKRKKKNFFSSFMLAAVVSCYLLQLLIRFFAPFFPDRKKCFTFLVEDLVHYKKIRNVLYGIAPADLQIRHNEDFCPALLIWSKDLD
ncbi:hypothetical protein CDAR_43901 [Caerostris darwini]|uniref:Uncharacterized protein n=1 Tax=Caerostris darwini TaxID=1538125 RepID=A0AAV4WGJ1_9ARAC|nr:hypothetical protein CDAR_43901 [Caerostris darwini]